MKRKATPIPVDDPEKDKVSLLWTKRFAALYEPLSLNIIREVCVYFGFELFFMPVISETTLKIYDIKNRTVTIYILPVKISRGAVYCFTNPHLIVSVADYFESTSAYMIDVPEIKVTEIAPMLKARTWPGIYCSKRYLYVFGGGVPKVKSSEKLTISTTTWSILPSMNEARYSFTPALFEGKLYLADASSFLKRIEIFNLLTETFHLLSIRLPSECNPSNTTSIVINGEYVLVSESLVRWKIKSEKAMRSDQLNIDEGIRPYSPTPPLLYSGFVYFSNYEAGQLVCLDLSSKSLLNEVSFRHIQP